MVHEIVQLIVEEKLLLYSCFLFSFSYSRHRPQRSQGGAGRNQDPSRLQRLQDQEHEELKIGNEFRSELEESSSSKRSRKEHFSDKSINPFFKEEKTRCSKFSKPF